MRLEPSGFRRKDWNVETWAWSPSPTSPSSSQGTAPVLRAEDSLLPELLPEDQGTVLVLRAEFSLLPVLLWEDQGTVPVLWVEDTPLSPRLSRDLEIKKQKIIFLAF